MKSAAFNQPLIPLLGNGRQQRVIEVTGAGLDPQAVTLADFPGGGPHGSGAILG